MKYWEFVDPYYALLTAETKEEAVEKYVKWVADDYEGHPLIDEAKEVTRDYSFAKFIYAEIRASSPNIKDIDVQEYVKEFNDPDSDLLLLDGSFL